MTTTTTTTTLAVGGATSKEDESVTTSSVAATAMAPLNFSSAPPPARHRPMLFARGGMRLGSCRLAAMLTLTTTTMRVRMMTSGSERTNPR